MRAASWLLAAGLLLTGVGGAFLPWVWRESVALQLTGPGLAEFVKFLPEIRTLQLEIDRLYFLYPLFLAMLALPLLIENRDLLLPSWLRWGLRLAVIPLALAAISPVWKPGVLIAPEFRDQTILALVAMGLAVIAPLLRGLSIKVSVPALIIGSLVATILPLRQFSQVQPSLEAIYNSPINLGWGWWFTLIGIIIALVGGLWAMLKAL